jgi:hypothetical protein
MPCTIAAVTKRALVVEAQRLFIHAQVTIILRTAMAANASGTITSKEKNGQADKPDKYKWYKTNNKAPFEAALYTDRCCGSNNSASTNRAQHPDRYCSGEAHGRLLSLTVIIILLSL